MNGSDGALDGGQKMSEVYSFDDLRERSVAGAAPHARFQDLPILPAVCSSTWAFEAKMLKMGPVGGIMRPSITTWTKCPHFSNAAA